MCCAKANWETECDRRSEQYEYSIYKELSMTESKLSLGQRTVNVPKRPKYANHIFSRVFRLDSASFLYRGGDSDPVYCISDRYSPFVKGEDPKAKVSIILEGDRPYQLRIAVRGHYHIEKPSYYVKDPREWAEWLWIIFPQDEISRLRWFLARFVDGNTKLWELII